MNLDALFSLLARAKLLCGHSDYVVIGSLSILVLEADFCIPPEMAMSIDVDCYTKDDPGRVFDVLGALGENSPHHLEFGFYLDGVSPNLATLPDGWQARLISLKRADLQAWFLEPSDAAVSKYARGEPRDIRWIRAGIVAGVVSLPMVLARLRSTLFLDDEEQRRAKALVDADRVWFDEIRDKNPTNLI